jgi:cell wall assembly regulator SMI1
MPADSTSVDAELPYIRAWAALERWLRANDPARGSGLRPGATEEDVTTVERLIGAPLPAAIRFAYLRHNGEEYDSFGLFEGYRWLPLLQVAEHWLRWQRQFADGRADRGRRRRSNRGSTQGKAWDPLRIPLSFNGGRGYHCVDLRPDDGVPGRIVVFEFATEDVVAESFEEWLAHILADFWGGKWEFGMYGDLVLAQGGRADA